MAVIPAGGGETIPDMAALHDQWELFAPVASPATAWQVWTTLVSALAERPRFAHVQMRRDVWIGAVGLLFYRRFYGFALV